MKPAACKLIIAFLFICTNSSAQGPTYPDGNSYAVSLTPTNADILSFSWKEDTFIFDAGEMHSAIMRKREGFKAAPYNPLNSNTQQDPVIKFRYETANKYGSTLKIEGTAQGNVIEGTVIWTNDNGEHAYTFTGTLIQ
ncbi:MAG: hypothetical protein HYZ14_10370 [Bacteroidetes bacterium]|nr:hypothetical protein [Bacteroidota bacterium]